jgi:uncharacterized protein DUF892
MRRCPGTKKSSSKKNSNLLEEIMKAKSLSELLVQQLEDLYDAENQLFKALPKMAEAASDTA